MANSTSGKPQPSKTTKRVTANKNILTHTSIGTTKKTNSTAKTTVAATAVSAVATVGAVKAIKKLGFKSLAIILACFIIALAIGAGVCFFIGKNDKFELVGSEHIELIINDKYTDDGVEIKEFGINLSNKAEIDTDLKQDANGKFYAESAGDYYIAYTVKSLKFGLIYPIQKIRLVSVVGNSEGGE